MTLEFASKIEGMLLAGELDFAFIDDYRMDKKVTTEVVAEEIFELCASMSYIENHRPIKYTKGYFESLDYIAYQEGEPVLRKWLAHHLKRRNMKLNVRAQVMDVRAVARYVMHDLGVGVIPHILLNTIRSEGYEIFTFKGKSEPLTNQIQLAYLKNRTHRSSALIVMDELRKSFKKR
jgi:DNA-binding transcriptional LysR family regulator